MIDPASDEDHSYSDGGNGDHENDDGTFRVFCGQTDEERREIRRNQRELGREIADLDILEARERNNKLNKKVRYIRESVLDAQNLDDIAKKATDKVDSMIKVRVCVRACMRTYVCARERNRKTFLFSAGFDAPVSTFAIPSLAPSFSCLRTYLSLIAAFVSF